MLRYVNLQIQHVEIFLSLLLSEGGSREGFGLMPFQEKSVVCSVVRFRIEVDRFFLL